MSSDIAVHLRKVGKNYALYETPLDRLKQVLLPGRSFHKDVAAVKSVTLDIKRGETVGLVGRNGSGKSTLLQMVCGTLTPTSGKIETHGRISALLELGAGFDPELTGHENIYLNAAILGLPTHEIDARYNDILEFSGIGDAIRQPVKTYSSGMYVRLAFAIAVASEPDILVVDEALAVGDEAFQRKCYARIRDIQSQGGTILLVSHSAATIIEMCDRAVLMEQGEMKAAGSPKSIINLYHKLIYAPKEKEAQVLASIASEVVGVDAAPESFDPDMRPQSTVVYESHGALIGNTRLETLEGEEVNQLTRGELYRYRFSVEFKKGAKKVRCGMMIKTLSGVELGGSSSAAVEKAVASVKPGDRAEVSFTFRAALFPGVYFMNSGCSGMVGDRLTFLHRITDALMFRVMPEQAMTGTGTVDFSIKPEIKVKHG